MKYITFFTIICFINFIFIVVFNCIYKMLYISFFEYEAGFNLKKNSLRILDNFFMARLFILIFYYSSIEIFLVFLCLLYPNYFLIFLSFSFLYLKFILEIFNMFT